MRTAIHRLTRRMAPRVARALARGGRPASRPADWGVAHLSARRRVARLDVQLPAFSDLDEVRLVLQDRAALHEVVVPATVTGEVVRALVPSTAISLLGTTVLDLWVEAAAEDGRAPVRRRVVVDGTDLDADLRAASAPGVRWYRTVNGRLSVEVTEVAGGVGDAPVMMRLASSPRTTEVGVETRAPATAGAVLTLRGRANGLVVDLPVPDDGSVEIADQDVLHLGPQATDLFVSTTLPDGSTVRRRLRAGPGLELEQASHELWRWEADDAGRLLVRRATPAEAIARSGIFDEDFYRQQVADLPAGVDPIEHYVARGAADGLDPSPMFDTDFYLRVNPDARRANALAHYCEVGWRQLRNPSPHFDTWWYWSKHLDPADEGVNPLAHYVVSGRAAGLSTRPSATPSRDLGPGFRLPQGRPVRRVCLFAAYDVHGIVDDYVVDYVRELARFADVYYLADSDMAESELAKLDGLTKGAWAQRHGEYDFGSYRRLAERVGWETLETYDELLLVNDSCYLVRPLDDVFEEMDSRATDWWGLQATKGLARTRRAADKLFREPIPMDSVRYSMIDRFEDDELYDFHVASYFLAYRTPVLRDPEFRRYLGSVTAQPSKIAIIQKYEIGLTRWLIHHGHTFDTFATKLYPFHPIFTQWHFTLLDEGFPLLKRFFLTENHYYVPRLKDWPERVLASAPDADVATFERNLRRITDPQKLRASLWIGTEEGVEDPPVPEQLLSRGEFVVADRLSPKHADWWAFPVCAFTENFSGNERAVFEHVKDDPSIRKIVLTRGKEIVVDGVNVDVVPLESPEGQHLLMRSGVILVKHSVARNAVHPVSAELHNIVQVWHGVPFKRIAYASEDFKSSLDQVAAEQAQYRAVIASSRIDSYAMAASFFPLTLGQVWNTGLPRNDFILQEEGELPPDMVAELAALRALVGDRRLVLFMPTFRNAQAEAYYQFEPDELEWLARWLEDNNCVLGLREHMADSARVYGSQLAHLPTLDLSDAQFVHPELLYRAADLLITDYSSAFIDFMLTGRPAISFAFDLESYEIERGGFYDLDQVFPGPIAKDFGELRTALSGVFAGAGDPTYALKRRLLHDHVDGQASARVATRIRELGRTGGLGTWTGERVA